MWETAVLFGGSFTVALSGALMPGPLFTLTVAESARRGFIAGPLLMIGHALLELLLVVAILLGLGPYLKQSLVMGVIAVVGGGTLVWLGVSMLRASGSLTLHQENGQQGRAAHPVVMGVLASLSNPYWTLWWATIGLGYLVSAARMGIPGITVFFLGHISGDLFWYSAVSYGVSHGKRILSDLSYQRVIRACGVFLLGFGGWFLASGKTYLLVGTP